MRLFIAIDFNKEVKDYMYHVVEELKKGSVRGNFVGYDNLHLTLSFLGELKDAKRVEEAMDRVVGIAGVKGFLIRIKGLGRFRRKEGDVLWAGIEQNEDLSYLQKCLTKELVSCGLEVEDREYRPHLTLARKAVLREGVELERFWGGDGDGDGIRQVEQMVGRISLMKSERVNGGMVYREIYGRELNSMDNNV